MTVKIDGTNTEANPAFTGADTDTGLQCGTNELKLVTGGTARATVDSSGRLLVGASSGAGKFIVQDPSLPKIQANYADSSHLEFGVGGSGGGFAMTTGHFMTVNHQPYADRGTDNNLTERMRLGSAGNCSIGTTTNTNKLRVHNGSDSANIILATGADESSEFISLGIDNSVPTLTAGGVGSNSAALAFRTSDNGTEVERLRIGSNGKFTTNTVQQYFDRGAATGQSSFSRDFTLGGTQSCLVTAAFNHYGLFGYGCVKISFAATGSSFSTHNVETYNSGNGGSWSITKPNNSTIRVTKNGGTYSGSGHWFIHVISS